MEGRRGALPVVLLAALLVLAAALRFSTLDVQSFGHDEAATVERVRLGLPDMLRAVANGESTPPLYYLVAWVWTKVFGTAEAGIRSLSAVFGTATVAVAYLAAARLASRRAALLAAALVAVNPLLVWYSQEARAYSLLALLCTTSFLFFVRALEGLEGRELAGWALASTLALASHYFSVFVIAPELVWLVVAARRSGLPSARLRAWRAAGFVAGSGLAVLPLAVHQVSTGGASWISGIPLGDRLRQLPALSLTAQADIDRWVLLAGALTLLGAALLATRAETEERRAALLPAAVGALAIALPVALSVTQLDYFDVPNVVSALPLLGVALAIGFSTGRARLLGVGAAALLSVLSVALVVRVALEPTLQRRDWRSAARAIGATAVDRALVVPDHGDRPLLVYLPRTTRMPPGGAVVREADVASVWFGVRAPRPTPVVRVLERRFGPVSERAGDRFSVLGTRSEAPRRVVPSMFDGMHIDGRAIEVLLQRAPRP